MSLFLSRVPTGWLPVFWPFIFPSFRRTKSTETVHDQVAAYINDIKEDLNGNIWIATDGFNRLGKADGIWVSATMGQDKALSKQFLRAPIGAEICSPCFTPDHKTMFCSVQHPADGSSFNQPTTRWPDFDKDIPPRPAVIAITHDQSLHQSV